MKKFENPYLDRRLSARDARRAAQYLKKLGYRLATARLFRARTFRNAMIYLEPGAARRRFLILMVLSALGMRPESLGRAERARKKEKKGESL